MNIKAIALDMDGTILNGENMVSNKLIKRIKELRNQGIRIFIATGRTKKEIYDVLPKSFKVDGFVAANEMSCFTHTKDIMHHLLQSDLVKKVVDYARNEGLYYEIHPKAGRRFALNKDKKIFKDELNKPRPVTLLNNEYNSRKDALQFEIEWVNEITYEENIKVYFFNMDPANIHSWKNKLTELQQENDLSLPSSSLHNVEIMVNGISKKTGVKYYLRNTIYPPTISWQ